MQKITVEVPRALIRNIRQYSGEGVTSAVRSAIADYERKLAQQELMKLKGSFTPSITAEEMRSC